MRNHEPYDEEKAAHQDPVIPISEWQEFNDAAGIEAMKWAEMELRAESLRRLCQEENRNERVRGVVG